jgi:hypothetical protein
MVHIKNELAVIKGRHLINFGYTKEKTTEQQPRTPIQFLHPSHYSAQRVRRKNLLYRI